MKQLEGIPGDVVRRVLQAAEDAGIHFLIANDLFITRGYAPVTAEQAAFYILDEDVFWVEFHGVKPERYHAWRKHIGRMEHERVPCLGTNAAGRPCGFSIPVAPDPKQYDPVIHDYCRHHGDQCPA